MGRFLAVVLGLLLVAGCQNDTHPQFSPAPSPTPHTEPTKAILQAEDVPAGLTVCQGSGPIDVYISVLRNDDSALADGVELQWVQLIEEGAQSGAVSVFAANSTACRADLGAVPNVKAMTSFVVRFEDEAQAEQAWRAGVFGFAPPAPGQLASGLTLGAATGLGASSFTFDRPSVRLASWRRGVFVALVVVTNLDLTTFKAATAAVDPRLN